MISWQGVSVTYGQARVLGPVSLEAGKGEWLGVIGPNGSGKSTLLKASVGVVDFEGRVTFSGGTVRAGIDVAWMPQRPHLPDEMTVSDYVMLGRSPHLGFLETEGARDRSVALSSLGLLDLHDFADRALSTLSGGEAQRVVLARALAQEAPVLLLDEPTANLDIGHAVEVMEIVEGLRRERGLTVVTAVHDLTLAGMYADRLALLSEGAIGAIGPPADVLTQRVLQAHYGPDVTVVPYPDGPAVLPSRPRR